MKIASYKIVAQENGWAIDHEGVVRGDYATKEIAFEVAAAAASNAIKQGYGINISAPESSKDEPALG